MTEAEQEVGVKDQNTVDWKFQGPKCERSHRLIFEFRVASDLMLSQLNALYDCIGLWKLKDQIFIGFLGWLKFYT